VSAAPVLVGGMRVKVEQGPGLSGSPGPTTLTL
jgi:hypothetical protein